MLPNGWDVKFLEEISDKIGDGLHGTPSYVDDGDYYFINGNNIKNGKITVSDSTKRISAEEFKKLDKKLNHKTILISINGTVGNLAFYNNEKVALGKSAAYILLKNGYDKNYIFYFLGSNSVQSFFNKELTGSTIKNLSLKTIRETRVLIPPKMEQEKIADILSVWDRAIGHAQSLTKMKREQYRYYLRKIFNNSSGLSPNWDSKSISECCDILDNKRRPLNSTERAGREGVIPYYGANGLVDYVTEAIFNEEIVLVAEDGGNFSEFLEKPVAYRVKHPCWVNNHAHVLKSKDFLCIDYLFYSLVHRDFTKYIAGGTRAKLNKGQLEKVVINYPKDVKEQKKISLMFDKFEEEIKILSNYQSSLISQKQGLMQQLLTGSKRVKV